jgi:hypothetical protein
LQGVADRLTDAVHRADDADAFAAAVVSLLNDTNARISLANRGLDVLARHFSPEQCYGPFVEHVDTACASPVTASAVPTRQSV